ncbi:MAG TPA: tryptophan--tRNA ligase [Candidatus Saccharimonadales bacterium]|nr:tryptophan--tRNA ligase [Candidatus Saccharimonadales bacterium]
MKTILTGIRSNNELTIGNYLGAILPIIDMAKTKAGEYQINMFVPDLHSFTTPIDHTKLYEQSLNNVRVFVAAGLPLGNENIHVYRQSYVPAHSELTWILDCFTGFGEMSRMTQFKDKSEKLAEDRVSVGLFNYPVLMAADILLYNAELVPVGDDQAQHIEFARDIAERMNAKFDSLFTVPLPVKKQHEFFGKDQGLRIRDLMDPTKKMSKSDETGKGVIFMTDAPEVAAKKIMSATTDSLAEIDFDMQKRPGISNLLQILALFGDQDLQTVIAKYKGQTQYGELKKDVAKVVSEFLSSFQSNLKAVSDEQILTKLKQSEAKMNKVANETLLKVQQSVGLRPKK